MLRARDGQVRQWAVLLVLVAVVPMATGCYGRFPLTKAVYKFNTELSNDDLMRSVAMWAMVVIPVYGVATLGDVLVIHLIEFWSSDRVSVGATVVEDGATVALAPSADGREMTLTVSREGTTLSRTVFVRTSDGEFEVRDARGRLAGKVVRTPGGDLHLTDADGRTVRTLSAEAVAAATGS